MMVNFVIERTANGGLTALVDQEDVGREVNADKFRSVGNVVSTLSNRFSAVAVNAALYVAEGNVQDIAGTVVQTVSPKP